MVNESLGTARVAEVTLTTWFADRIMPMTIVF